MKWLIFLLILANLLFFAFSEGYLGRPHNPDALRLKKQIRPEAIRVVSRDGPPPLPNQAETKPEGAKTETVPPATEPKPEATAAVPAEVCLMWNELSGKDVDLLTALLTGKFPDFKQTKRPEKTQGKSWWVSIGPLPSKAEADKKAKELKELGIKEYIVVHDVAANRFAISLGVFSNESGAKTRLASLREAGVRSAKVEPYPSKETFAIEARGVAARRQALLDATQSASSLKYEAKACP
ncbi:MAG: Sporulation related domain protein [Betaproteobacteria bacterium ADurb.Bin341]|nr:MAG: Sporulation related domain protein [Betaproteobacteria bacterium ADurb.Bin341]